jgi:tyrosinase
VFWLWQKLHKSTDKLEIIDKYPGTNSSDSQGATPGTPPNSWLTLESPLEPYKHANGKYVTSMDVINIEKQLNYTYEKGSLDTLYKSSPKPESGAEQKKLAVTNINRAGIRGSFTISAFMHVDGKKYYLGSEAILSRWNVSGCRNCQTHLEAKAFFDIEEVHTTTALKALNGEEGMQFSVEVHGREDSTGTNKELFKAFAATNANDRPYHIDII